MRPLKCVYLFMFILYLSVRQNAAATSKDGTCATVAGVDETCKTLAEGEDDIDEDFCVSTLKSDPRSASADMHGLAVIATKQLLAHASSTESKIEEMMELETDGKEKDVFESCLDEYRDALDKLNDALDNLNSKLYDEAIALMEKVFDAGEICEEAFLEVQEGASPVASEDRNYGQLAGVALALAKSVE
ncbi:Plant invertase/pectin methylesterase inhibitor protein [Dioscorea alata]|uniref:Plant invertase/pectin methylesterase inhibitor protein n=1 Tax=Dioscorea alata TaxID=55571 RepID=A0ACB7WVJ6_DIOAL|nr:Plant invertase/pectin methylesterase inhibitor protein [Dioscorea alata]